MTLTHNDNQGLCYSLNDNIIDYSINMDNLNSCEIQILDKIRNNIFANSQITNGNGPCESRQLIDDISELLLSKFPELFCQECMDFAINCLNDFIQQRHIF